MASQPAKLNNSEIHIACITILTRNWKELKKKKKKKNLTKEFTVCLKIFAFKNLQYALRYVNLTKETYTSPTNEVCYFPTY